MNFYVITNVITCNAFFQIIFFKICSLFFYMNNMDSSSCFIYFSPGFHDNYVCIYGVIFCEQFMRGHILAYRFGILSCHSIISYIERRYVLGYLRSFWYNKINHEMHIVYVWRAPMINTVLPWYSIS